MDPGVALLASPRRLEILRLVWHDDRSAGEIHRELGDITFGAVSQQLGHLLQAGLVRVRCEGRRRIYRAQRARVGPIARALEATWGDALYRLKIRAELEQGRRGPRRGHGGRPAAQPPHRSGGES